MSERGFVEMKTTRRLKIHCSTGQTKELMKHKGITNPAVLESHDPRSEEQEDTINQMTKPKDNFVCFQCLLA